MKPARPIFPVACEFQTEIPTILDLRERDAIAFRRAARHRRTAAARSNVCSGASASEIEAWQRAGSVDRESTLERKRISTEPAAKHDAHVQLCIGTEAIVAPKVEQAARVLRGSQRVGSRWAGHRCSRRNRSAAVLQRGVHEPSRPRIVGVRARVESQLGRRDVERPVVDERIVAPRSIAIKDREWILQVSRRPSFVAI